MTTRRTASSPERALIAVPAIPLPTAAAAVKNKRVTICSEMTASECNNSRNSSQEGRRLSLSSSGKRRRLRSVHFSGDSVDFSYEDDDDDDDDEDEDEDDDDDEYDECSSADFLSDWSPAGAPLEMLMRPLPERRRGAVGAAATGTTVKCRMMMLLMLTLTILFFSHFLFISLSCCLSGATLWCLDGLACASS